VIYRVAKGSLGTCYSALGGEVLVERPDPLSATLHRQQNLLEIFVLLDSLQQWIACTPLGYRQSKNALNERHLHSIRALSDPISIPTVRWMTLSPFQECVEWPHLHSNRTLIDSITIPIVRWMTLSPFQQCAEWPFLHSNSTMIDPILNPIVRWMTIYPFQ
jgi:hypothetical protein